MAKAKTKPKADPRNATAFDKKLGAAIKQRREEKDVSQDTLAKAIGVTFQQVQKYENGTNRLSVERLLKVCKALGVTSRTVLESVEA